MDDITYRKAVVCLEAICAELRKVIAIYGANESQERKVA